MGHLKPIDFPESNARGTSSGTAAKGRWWVWILILAVVVGGFWYYRTSRSNSQSAAGETPAKGGGGRGGRGANTANLVVPVVVATAQRGDLPVYFNGLGTVTAFNTVTIHSRVDGQLVNVAFKEGQFVHQGDLLVEIDPRPFQVQLEQAEGQLAKDQAQRKDAEVNFERFKLLYQEGVIPKQQLDTQGAQVGQFDGAIKTDVATIDSAKLQLVYCRITAPISGRVGLRLVDVGNIVHAADATGLLVITQLQPISVIFSLPQDQLPDVNSKLRNGAQLAVDAYDRDDTSKLASGKLATIDNQIDTTTGTYKLKSIFSNDDNILFPNQFVNVHLLVDTKHNLTIVPTAAIQRGPQGTYVYVVEQQGADSKTKIQTVTIAQSTGNQVGLSQGINPGDVVVIDGADKLAEDSKVRATTVEQQQQQQKQHGGGSSGNSTHSRKPSSPAGTAPAASSDKAGGALR
ncbi:MAG TPA: MdtA/MuxA family multidrug efflux RND transporter periplasmic adaptor subunit [Terriglobales bacterium]|nr:MdtA/MuxA family multidrug efflux RND transporter periplasmic adaptor subunit [Terriglobales bacterium]